MFIRFLRNLRPLAHTRNAFLVIVAALCLIVTGAVLAFPPPGGGPFILNGMMGPDNFMVHPDHGRPITYSQKMNRDGSYLVSRNGVPWLTISHKNGVVEVRDPNGAPAVVIIKTTEKGH